MVCHHVPLVTEFSLEFDLALQMLGREGGVCYRRKDEVIRAQMGPRHTPWGKVCLELELKSGYLLSHPKLTFWGLAVASWALSLPTARLDPLLSHSSPWPVGAFSQSPRHSLSLLLPPGKSGRSGRRYGQNDLQGYSWVKFGLHCRHTTWLFFRFFLSLTRQ